MQLQLLTGPSVEPLTLAEVKEDLRVDGTASDANITALLGAARVLIEQMSERAFCLQTYRMTLDEWPIASGLMLPRPPLRRIEAVRYVDTDGAAQTLDAASYAVVEAGDAPARLAAVWGVSWPTTRGQLDAITVEFVAGYDDGSSPYNPASVPAPLRQAIKLQVREWFDGTPSIDAIRRLVAPYRVWLPW